MNKEEILSKYRNENKDEGWEYIQSEGFACGFVAYVIVCFLMFFINVSNGYGGSEAFFFTFFYATSGIDNCSKYKMLREKKYLRRMIFWAVLTILGLGVYISRVMGW